MKPPPLSPTDVRQYNLMMRKVRIARKLRMVFHGSPKRHELLKPRRPKYDVLHITEYSRALVFASPRFEVAVIHALLPPGQRRWRIRRDKKVTLEVPLGGFRIKKTGGFIHAFPDGQHLIGNKQQRGSNTPVRPRMTIKVPARALEILGGTRRVIPIMSDVVKQDLKERILVQQ